jgi:hypothetical protein
MGVLERTEAVDDLLDGRVTDNIFHRERVDLGERVEVVTDG